MTDSIASLAEANRLESSGSPADAIALCEKVLDGTELPEHYLTLARNYFNLAVTGNETFAWKALLAALEGIEQRAKQARQADVEHAVGIIKWTLDHFSDWSRLDVSASYVRSFAADEQVGLESGTAMAAMYRDYQQLLGNRDSMALANRVYRESPMIVRPGRSEEGIERESRLALANQFSQLPGSNVGKYLEGIGLPVPGDYNFQLYDKYLFTAGRAELQRLKARARGVPAIMLSCMPKSASAFLAYALADVLEAPIVRGSIGDPLLGVVVEDWVAEIAKGGCVLHDHFGGRAENLAALRHCGVNEIFVLVRDPRAVAFSLRNMSEELGGSHVIGPAGAEPFRSSAAIAESKNSQPMKANFSESDPRRQAPNFARTVRMLSGWIESWTAAKEGGLVVKFIAFSDLVSNPLDVMSNLLDQSGAGARAHRLPSVLATMGKGSNFRRGDDNAWRRRIPPVVAEDAWAAIAPPVRRLLHLTA